MNKEKYLHELEKNLSSLPVQEKSEALIFYGEYLTDMEENNPESISTLEPPVQIAAQIKAESAIKNSKEKGIKSKKGLSTAWTVLLAIFALPVGLPIAVSIAVVAISLIVVAFSLVISLYATAFSLAAYGLFSLVTAVIMIPTSLAVSLFYLGAGLLGLGLGFILVIAITMFSKQLFVWIAKLINNIRLKIRNRQNPGSANVNYGEAPVMKDSPQATDAAEQSNTDIPKVEYDFTGKSDSPTMKIEADPQENETAALANDKDEPKATDSDKPKKADKKKSQTNDKEKKDKDKEVEK